MRRSVVASLEPAQVLELKGEIEKERKSRLEWEDKGVISVRSSSEHQRLKVLSDQELERVNNVNSELREELKSNKSRIGEFEIIVSRITSECDDHKIKAEKEFKLRVGLEKRLESLTLEYNTLNSSSNESNILLATLKSKSNNSELLNKDFTIKLEKIEEELRRVRKEGDEWGREKVRVERVNVGLSEDLKVREILWSNVSRLCTRNELRGTSPCCENGIRSRS